MLYLSTDTYRSFRMCTKMMGSSEWIWWWIGFPSQKWKDSLLTITGFWQPPNYHYRQRCTRQNSHMMLASTTKTPPLSCQHTKHKHREKCTNKENEPRTPTFQHNAVWSWPISKLNPFELKVSWRWVRSSLKDWIAAPYDPSGRDLAISSVPTLK